MTKKTIIIISAISLFCLVGGSVLAFSQFQNSQKVSQNNSSISSQSSVSNSIQNSNPEIKPLVADADHDVIVLEVCDLAIKYKKSIIELRNKGDLANLLITSKSGQINDQFGIYRINCDNLTSKDSKKEVQYYLESATNLGSQEANKYDFTLFSPSSISKIDNFLKVNSKNSEVKAVGFSFNQKRYYLNFLNPNLPEKLEDYIQIQPNSLAPSTPTVKLENSQNNSQNNSQTSQIASKKCDALECFVGKIGNQTIIIKKIKDEGAGAGSSYFSGTINYTNAGNTPIPIKWRQINSVDCGAEGIYLCRNITIEENLENGGTIAKDIKYNKNTQKEEIGETKWTSKNGQTILKAEFSKVDTISK